MVHYFPWHKLDNLELEPHLAEIAEAGAKYLVLTAELGEKEFLQAGYLKKFKKNMERFKLNFRAAHGFWWANNDLNWPDEQGRRSMVCAQSKFMCCAAEVGVLTYTVHPGVCFIRYDENYLWDKVRRSIEELLEVAEKCKITLALENNLEYNLGRNSHKLASIIAEFGNHSNLGACFDSGHAHIKENVFDSIDALSPYMVTCHLHDNDSTADKHQIPGMGTINWSELMIKLRKDCTRLLHFESEASNLDGKTYGECCHIYETL